ncbi:glycine zipper 2TM domain-containing protein [Erythrobacter cryptus]|uniref:glycine zipper 2TM domain-containing protein n=1 Tax=Erythrobacter cryptus TaxID=196588 RepID=UPI000410076B|nr:glycine zipper 2TM domain-containing protein [Erythrobacter cryptus]
MRLPLRLLASLGVALPALALPTLAKAQNYSDLPPLTPMGEAEMQALPADMRSAPLPAQVDETVTVVDGVETITRTRRIAAPRPAATSTPAAAPPTAVPPTAAPHAGPAAYPGAHYPGGYAPAYMPAAAPVVFEREQWLAECRRRTKGMGRDETGLIIGGLLGAIAGGVAGYEIAGAGDRVLGTVLGAGGGGLIGGLLGSLFDRNDKRRYDCEAALDAYLSQPTARIASREIAYPAYGAYPAYAYGYAPAYAPAYTYAYAPPPQMVLVPVRSEVPQQVVVRENIREETYAVPGAAREIPAPPPSPKMIKLRRGR